MDSNLYWIGFQMADRKRRWLCINNELKLEGQDWFNKNTKNITISRGYETEENSTAPISATMYRVLIDCNVPSYFGDKSGRHHKNKIYMLVGGDLYKQECGPGRKVLRLTNELKQVMALAEAESTWNKVD